MKMCSFSWLLIIKLLNDLDNYSINVTKDCELMCYILNPLNCTIRVKHILWVKADNFPNVNFKQGLNKVWTVYRFITKCLWNGYKMLLNLSYTLSLFQFEALSRPISVLLLVWYLEWTNRSVPALTIGYCFFISPSHLVCQNQFCFFSLFSSREPH